MKKEHVAKDYLLKLAFIRAVLKRCHIECIDQVVYGAGYHLGAFSVGRRATYVETVPRCLKFAKRGAGR